MQIKHKIILAPMAAVNSGAFRLICKKYGCGIVSTAMIDTAYLVQNTEKCIAGLNLTKEEKPISIQLIGEQMREGTKIIEKYADIIDVNLGCPEKDILSRRLGGFFSKHPDQIKKVVKPVIDNTNKKVSAKIRIGWDKDRTTLNSIKELVDLGVEMISIHGRSVKQGYSGKADWSEIKKAKEKYDVTIVGNGDVFKPGNAKAMLEQTKCDSVMIGRGVKGNPYLFKQINELINNENLIPDLNDLDKVNLFLEFYDLYKKQKVKSFGELRDHALWFSSGMSNAKSIRKNILMTKNYEDLINVFKI